MVDAINICLWKKTEPNALMGNSNSFPQWIILRELSQLQLRTPNLHSNLLILEGVIQRKGHDEREIQNAYNKLLKDSWGKNGKNSLLTFILKLRKQTTRGAKHNVRLVSKNDPPYKRETLAINRFLAWCLSEDLTKLDNLTKKFLRNSTLYNEFSQVKIRREIGRTCLSRNNSDTVFVCNARDDGISRPKHSLSGHLITRHGPHSALQTHFPKLCEIATNHLSAPNLLDQTREVAWPENFFGRERSGRQILKPDFFIIKKVTLDFAIELHAKEYGKNWFYMKGKYTYELKKFDPNNKSKLVIEHHVLPIPRADLRVVSTAYKNTQAGNKKNPTKTVYFEEISSRSRQSSSIAYFLKYPTNAKKGDRIEIKVSAFQCGSSGMPETIGFRYYPEIKLDELEVNITLKNNLIAEKLDKSKMFKKGMMPYLEPLRRIGYEDGTDESGNPISPVKNIYSKTWKKGDMKSGYFYGLCWDRLRIDKER